MTGSKPRASTHPDFDAFWAAGEVLLPQLPLDGGTLRAFREDPEGTPLPTTSGKIEITSDTIASFSYDDCPGHPVWLHAGGRGRYDQSAAARRQSAGVAPAQPARFRWA